MPCSDGYGNREHDIQYERAEGAWNIAQRASRAACDMRTVLRRHNLLSELTAETRQWVVERDAEDAARIAREEANGVRDATKKRALDKLNLDERRALGL